MNDDQTEPMEAIIVEDYDGDPIECNGCGYEGVRGDPYFLINSHPLRHFGVSGRHWPDEVVYCGFCRRSITGSTSAEYPDQLDQIVRVLYRANTYNLNVLRAELKGATR